MALFEETRRTTRDLLGAIEVREHELDAIARRHVEVVAERAEHEAEIRRCDMRLEDFDRRGEDLQAQLAELRSALGELRAEREHTPRRDAEAEWRDAMRSLGSFTIPELAGKLGMTPEAARLQVNKFEAKGAIRDAKRRFMKAKVYEYVQPKEAGAAAELSIEQARDRRKHEREHIQRMAKSTPVAGTGRGFRFGDDRYNYLMEKLLENGFELKSTTGKHVKFFSPILKQTITFPKTPSDHRSYNNDLAHVRRIGIAA